MKLTGKNMPPGEWAFKALFKIRKPNRLEPSGWTLSAKVFFTKEEADKYAAPNYEIIWPVEEYEGGIVYIPTKEELEND